MQKSGEDKQRPPRNAFFQNFRQILLHALSRYAAQACSAIYNLRQAFNRQKAVFKQSMLMRGALGKHPPSLQAGAEKGP